MRSGFRTVTGAAVVTATWLAIVGVGAQPAAAGPGLVVGAVEDGVRASSLVDAETRMTLFRAAGFRAVRVTSLWTPGLSEPDPGELTVLQNVATAAQMNGVRVFVTVMSPGSRTTPLTDDDRAQFASYSAGIVGSAPGVRELIVGNEPTLNRFWVPQFARDGSDAAAPAYVALLAQTYDAVKAAAPGVTV